MYIAMYVNSGSGMTAASLACTEKEKSISHTLSKMIVQEETASITLAPFY